LDGVVSESIDTPWGLSVFGAGSVSAEPDVARVRLAVDLIEQTPDKAFAAANEAVSRVREVVREHGISEAAVSESRLRLTSAFDGYGASRKFLGYQCQAAFVVESADLAGLQQLLIDVVQAGAHRVDGVEFDVTNKAELRDKARAEAVKSARRKAEVYATACGVSVGPVIHIQDVDPESHVGLYRGHGGGGAESAADLAPGQVLVEAAVLLGFSLPRA
jgi:uncharacterized protein